MVKPQKGKYMTGNPREVICKECGKKFVTTAGRAKYCGLACAYQAENRRRKKWEIDNPTYYRDYYEKRKAESQQAANRQKR